MVRTFTAEGLPEHLAFSPDGQRLAASHPYFGLQLFDVATGERVVDARYEGDHEDSGIGDVVYGPDALFRVGRRHGISVHDPVDGRALGWLPQHPDDTHEERPPGWPDDLSYQNQLLAVSPDGRWIASIQTRDWTLYAVRFWAVR